MTGYPLHFVLEKHWKYECDTKANPLKAADDMLYALYLNHSPHNIIKERVYNENSRLVETQSFEYQYRSNNLLGKAVEITAASGKPTTTRNITYTY